MFDIISMDSLPDDLLAWLLIEYNTYRAQYILAQVCGRWHRMITTPPPGWRASFDVLSLTVKQVQPDTPQSKKLRQIADIYNLLLQPIYRPLFILHGVSERRFRKTVIHQLINNYGYAYYLDDIIIKLCNRIDNARTILAYGYEKYWEVVARQSRNPNTSDIGYEQMCILFSAN